MADSDRPPDFDLTNLPKEQQEIADFYNVKMDEKTGVLKERKRSGNFIELKPAKNGRRRFLAHDGYVFTKPFNKPYLAEHRYIMEKMLGRKLKKFESVHHKDGIRHNNKRENLELWLGGIRYGQRAKDIKCPHCKLPYNTF